MAAELAPKNIRVCAINPVIGETGMLEQFMGMPDTPANRAQFLATIPLGRFSTAGRHRQRRAVPRFAREQHDHRRGLEVDGGRCVLSSLVVLRTPNASIAATYCSAMAFTVKLLRDVLPRLLSQGRTQPRRVAAAAPAQELRIVRRHQKPRLLRPAPSRDVRRIVWRNR
jgi:hypothetical protein